VVLAAPLQTVTAGGLDVNELQTITTAARPGQTLGGFFTVSFLGSTTVPIPAAASPDLVKARLETGLPRIGIVKVGAGAAALPAVVQA
jgi:hypothetical protein